MVSPPPCPLPQTRSLPRGNACSLLLTRTPQREPRRLTADSAHLSPGCPGCHGHRGACHPAACWGVEFSPFRPCCRERQEDARPCQTAPAFSPPLTRTHLLFPPPRGACSFPHGVLRGLLHWAGRCSPASHRSPLLSLGAPTLEAAGLINSGRLGPTPSTSD